MLKLSIFSGNPMDWLQYKQVSTQVCNYNLNENLWRLRKYLRGPTKDAVVSLLIKTTKYFKIMSTLKLRSGNSDTIISRIIHDIKNAVHVSRLPQGYYDVLSKNTKFRRCCTSRPSRGIPTRYELSVYNFV